MTEHWFVFVILQIVILKNKKWTYRVNSSVNCVWSGGKNFTTKRRMVFFGPEDRNQHPHLIIRPVISYQIGVKTHRWTCLKLFHNIGNLETESGGDLRLICFSVGFSRSSHTWREKPTVICHCWCHHNTENAVSVIFDSTDRTAEFQGSSGRTDVPHSPAFCDGLRTPVQNSLPLSGSSGHKPGQTALYQEIVAKRRGKGKWQTQIRVS